MSKKEILSTLHCWCQPYLRLQLNSSSFFPVYSEEFPQVPDPLRDNALNLLSFQASDDFFKFAKMISDSLN